MNGAIEAPARARTSKNPSELRWPAPWSIPVSFMASGGTSRVPASACRGGWPDGWRSIDGLLRQGTSGRPRSRRPLAAAMRCLVESLRTGSSDAMSATGSSDAMSSREPQDWQQRCDVGARRASSRPAAMSAHARALEARSRSPTRRRFGAFRAIALELAAAGQYAGRRDGVGVGGGVGRGWARQA